jgi:hypothetical protein
MISFTIKKNGKAYLYSGKYVYDSLSSAQSARQVVREHRHPQLHNKDDQASDQGKDMTAPVEGSNVLDNENIVTEGVSNQLRNLNHEDANEVISGQYINPKFIREPLLEINHHPARRPESEDELEGFGKEFLSFFFTSVFLI